MLSAAQYRAQTQTLHSQEMKIAYSDNTLKQYIPRIAEFVEFVFRRYSAGPTFPLCTVEHIDSFFQFFVTRGKFRSSVMHAHNRTTTASMLAEHVKATLSGDNIHTTLSTCITDTTRTAMSLYLMSVNCIVLTSCTCRVIRISHRPWLLSG